MPSRPEHPDIKHFKVDAALLRELGQRLIGRAHIALAELVKNSYDADAHNCEIKFDSNQVVISDDGHGISEEEFLSYWMRIGTTHKVAARLSRDLQRPMTGSKGLGRLSVQFIADEMEIESTCRNTPNDVLYAYVDWRSANSGADIETVPVELDVTEKTKEFERYANNSATGTRITLSGLRAEWGGEAIEDLGKELWLLRSPFRTTRGHKRGNTALDFYVDVEAPQIKDAKARFDRLQRALFENWKARITGHLEYGRRPTHPNEAKVTIEFAPNYPEGMESAVSFRETLKLPISKQKESKDSREPVSDDTEKEMVAELAAIDKSRFVILVFKPEGRQPGGLAVKDVREFLRTHGSVSVYDAGFRLPYYGSEDLNGQDWLNIASDQGRRLQASELLPERLRTGDRYLLNLPNPGRLFGSVDIDTNHERRIATELSKQDECLQIQPGRDRLAPNRSFEQLRDFVRFGLDLYANRYTALADDVAQKQLVKMPPSRVVPELIEALQSYQDDIPKPAYVDLKRRATEVSAAVKVESKSLESRAALLGPLATAGMAALAMNHEFSNDAVLLKHLMDLLQELPHGKSDPKVKRAIESLGEFQSRLNKYQVLFSPLVNSEDREAVRRLPVSSVVNNTIRALRFRLPGVAFGPVNISRDLHFPMGSFVEWSAILQNLLFNAWNAMLDVDQRIIRFDASSASQRRQHLCISDTGSGLAIPLNEASTLFEAFERRTPINDKNRSIAIGGQGLGLAIVRMIGRRRGVDAAFVNPPSGFSTTIQLSWRS